MSSKRREYKVDDRAKKVDVFFQACEANADTRLSIPAAMRAKGFSDVEAVDQILVQQVCRESQKKTPKDTPCPESAAALSLLALSTTANVGRAALATITPVLVAVSVLLAAGVAALPLPSRKTQKMSHQEQIARQNKRKCRAVQGQAHACQIAICSPNWTGYPGQKNNHTTINRWVPLWSTNQTWDGKAALFVAAKNRGKIYTLRVGKAWPIGKWAAHLNGFARSYTSNTPQSTLARLGGGGIGQGIKKWLCFVVCIFLEFYPAGFFMASLNCDRAGKFDCSTRSPPHGWMLSRRGSWH
jgi:hypothetical protein